MRRALTYYIASVVARCTAHALLWTLWVLPKRISWELSLFLLNAQIGEAIASRLAFAMAQDEPLCRKTAQQLQ